MNHQESSEIKREERLYINEDLTLHNWDLYRKAWLVNHVLCTWASDEKIFVKLLDESVHVVRYLDDHEQRYVSI